MDLDQCNLLKGRRVWVKRPGTGLHLGVLIEAQPSPIYSSDVDITVRIDGGGGDTTVRASARGDTWDLLGA
jgi:hypothetical protein